MKPVSPVNKELRNMCAICTTLLACVLFSFPRSAHAQGVNIVYVESNIGTAANQNSVYAFSNDGLGNLTPLPGSPYLTGGTGFHDTKGGSVGTENQVVVRKSGNLLLAVNAHTNTIAVFNINADGSLTTVPGSPFPSGGEEPLSLALSDDLLGGGRDVLTVSNHANDPAQAHRMPSYNTFVVSSTGVLTPVFKVSLPLESNPTQVTAVGAHGEFVVTSQIGFAGLPAKLSSYSIQPTGGMKLNNSLSYPTTLNLLGNVPHPTMPILYTGQPGRTEVGVYTWNQNNGDLTLVRTVRNHGRSLCWLAINADGTRLYTVENGSSSVSVYDLSANPELPVEIQHVVLSGAKAAPTNMRIDPTGKFAYVVDVAQKSVHVLNVNADGTLTETKAPTPLPGLRPDDLPIGLATLLK